MGTPSDLGSDHLQRLLDVGRGLVSKHDPEAVLEQVLEAARELTGARYAALGVLDDDKRELARFLTVGIDDEHRQRIGPLPRGRGMLGELIRAPCPVAARADQRPRPFLRIPGRAPAHGHLPRGPGDDPRRGLRQPLPDREAGWRGVRRSRRAAAGGPRRVGGDRDRQRPVARGQPPPRRRARAGAQGPRGDRHAEPRGRGRDRPASRAGAGRETRARARRRPQRRARC